MKLKTIPLAFTIYEANWWLASTSPSTIYLCHTMGEVSTVRVTQQSSLSLLFFLDLSRTVNQNWANLWRSQVSEWCFQMGFVYGFSTWYFSGRLDVSQYIQQAYSQYFTFSGWKIRWKVNSNIDLIKRHVYIHIPPTSRSSKKIALLALLSSEHVLVNTIIIVYQPAAKYQLFSV